MYNYLSFDLEDWFHVPGKTSIKPINEWNDYEERVIDNTKFILDILDNYDTKATFFILGWIADNYPRLVEDVASRGHEIGTHGYAHELVYKLGPAGFEQDLNKSIKIIEKHTSKEVLGFRAPSFSINADTPWAYSIIRKLGLKFDSSMFLASRAYGGYGSTSQSTTKPHVVETDFGNLIEVPMTVVNIFNKKVPMCGGGYLRAYPLSFINWGLSREINSGRVVNYYLHPKDIDPSSPTLDMSFWKQFKYNIRFGSTKNKFIKLITKYNFMPIFEGLKANRKRI